MSNPEHILKIIERRAIRLKKEYDRFPRIDKKTRQNKQGREKA